MREVLRRQACALDAANQDTLHESAQTPAVAMAAAAAMEAEAGEEAEEEAQAAVVTGEAENMVDTVDTASEEAVGMAAADEDEAALTAAAAEEEEDEEAATAMVEGTFTTTTYEGICRHKSSSAVDIETNLYKF